jgi:hypothetical protein
MTRDWRRSESPKPSLEASLPTNKQQKFTKSSKPA